MSDDSYKSGMNEIDKSLREHVKKDKMFAAGALNIGMRHMTESLQQISALVEELPDISTKLKMREVFLKLEKEFIISAVACVVVGDQLASVK